MFCFSLKKSYYIVFVVVIVINVSHFQLYLDNKWANFKLNMASLQVCANRGSDLPQKKINSIYNIVKNIFTTSPEPLDHLPNLMQSIPRRVVIKANMYM